MKKITFLFSVVLCFLLVSLSSCDKEICTTCTESGTGVSEEFCGTKSEVDSFEETLNELGTPLGQNWNCQR